MRTLVTGGAGFIGSHVVDSLVARGDEVVVIDDLSSGRVEDLADDIDTFVEGDIGDPDAVARAMRGCEIVFHFAAHRAVSRSMDRPVDTDRANTGGTLTVLEAARQLGVRRIVSASSSSVYGGARRLPTTETEPLQPRSPYAVSKLAGEHYCRVFSEIHGLETVSLRYFNIYGPRQPPETKYAAVVPLFIDALRHAEAPAVHGDGLQSRSFTYVADAVSATLAASAAPAARCDGQAFNVAGADHHTLLEVLDEIGDQLGVVAQPVFGSERPGDVRHTHADVSLARERLDWSPEFDLATGIALTIAWFAAQER